MRHQRRISRRNDDDRSEFLGAERVMAGAKLFADRHAGHCQLDRTSAIELHENSHGVAARLAIEPARRGADSTFPSVADHPGAPADASFDHWPATRIRKSGERMIGGDME